jgi:uncharacterized protein (DUF58 family)
VDEHSPWRGFVSALAVLAALLGFASGSVALLGLAAGIALLLLLALLSARRGLRGVEVRRTLPPSAFENDLLTVDLVVENHATRAARFVEAGDVFGAGLADRQSVLEPGPLPPLHRRVLSYRAFVARQWGLYTVGPLSVGSWDPLGLFHARRTIDRMDPFEVFPRAVEVEALAAQSGQSTLVPRDVTEAAAGQSLLFRGVRDFQAGDDVRRIHWPATARRGAPMVREYERDLEPVFTLFLDLERGGRAGLGRRSTLEHLVRAAASLLWTAHRRGDQLSLVAEQDQPVLVPPGQGEVHLAAALHQLVIARQTGTVPLLDLVERHRELVPSGATAVLLLGTTEVDLDRLSETVEGLQAAIARPLVVAVDALTFTPVDRPPTPVDEVRARRRALEDCLQGLDVPAAILGADDTPEEVLVRPDLFVLPTEATA